MDQKTRLNLIAFLLGVGAGLNLLAALGGGGYPGAFVLLSLVPLGLAAALYWKGRR